MYSLFLVTFILLPFVNAKEDENTWKRGHKITGSFGDTFTKEGDREITGLFRASNCPENHDYRVYDGDLCVVNQLDYLSWFHAQASCQQLGGNLMQISDWKKSTFVRDNVTWPGDLDHWIGVSDLDMDGIYEYVNGRIVRGREPGLGEWSFNAPPNPDLKKRQLCVSLKTRKDKVGDEYWSSGPCDELKLSICERPMNRDILGDRTNYVECTIDYCWCSREHWKYYDNENIYVKLNHVSDNFENSALNCERLGGQLVTVHDEAKQTYIKNLLSSNQYPKGVLYWMGLARQEKDWIWDDGRRLSSTDYQEWFEDVGDNKDTKCVGVVWDFWGKWRPTHCSKRLFHICEASKPCTAWPALVINGKERSNDEGVRISIGRISQIMCRIKGYDHIVKAIVFNCGTGPMGSFNRSIELSLLVTLDMHLKPCGCQLIYKDETTRAMNINFVLKTPPRFRLGSENNNNKTFIKKPGDQFVVTFEISASPRPEVLGLFKNENPMDSSVYNVTIRGVDETLYYNVTFQLKNFTSSKMAGTYTLSIDNGISQPLEYNFILKLKSKEESQMVFYYTLAAMCTILMVPLVVLVVGCYRGRTRRKIDEDIDEEEEADANDSTVDQVKEESPPQPPTTRRYGSYTSTELD